MLKSSFILIVLVLIVASFQVNAYVPERTRAGIIDIHGNWVVKPIYKKLLPSGLKNHWWFSKKYSGPFGLIDHLGNIVIEPSLLNTNYFYQGDAWVNHKTKGWIKLDEKFNTIATSPLNPSYRLRTHGSKRMGEVIIENNRQQKLVGIVDSNNNWLVKPEYHEIVWPYTNGDPIWLVKKIGKEHRVEATLVPFDSPNTKITILKLGFSPDGFENGLAGVMSNGSRFRRPRWGFVNTKGKWVIKPKYSRVNPFVEGVASVSIPDEVADSGVIDLKGHWLIKPRYRSISNLGQGLFSARNVNETWVFVNRNGKEVSQEANWRPIAGTFGSAFNEGLHPMAFHYEDSIAYVNTKGEVQFKLDSVLRGESFFNGYAIVSTKERKPGSEFKYGLIKRDGSFQLDIQYRRLKIDLSSPGYYIADIINDN